MKKFKTNIKCEGCVEKVTPGLNQVAGEANWKVNLQDPNRVLTVDDHVNEQSVVESLKKAGYHAEKLA